MRKLIFTGGEWNENVRKRLEPACDRFMSVEDLEDAIKRGAMSLFSVFEEGNEVCNFVLRLDGEEDNLEMVVVCAGGHLTGGSLFKVCTPYIEKIARECKANYIRGHVNSMAKAKLMEKAGYNLDEFIFRKAVNHGWQVQ